MNDSTLAVFGKPPPGVVYRDRMAAYAVITNPDGAVAVVSVNFRGREAFWLPGGGMLDGESPKHTVAREVWEELGREVKLYRTIGQAIQFFYAADDDCWYKMMAYFFVAELQRAPAGYSEFELQWVNPTLHKSDFFHECHVWAALDAT